MKKRKKTQKAFHEQVLVQWTSIIFFLVLIISLPLFLLTSQKPQHIKQNAAGTVNPLLFGTNLGLYDTSDQFLTSQTTRDALKSIHVQIIRMPIRFAGGPAPQEITAMQLIKSMGLVPLIILKYSQTDPTGAAKLVIQQANAIFGNSIVYYEFGNERDLNGVNQSQYTSQWNQTIPQVKSLPINGRFGGPTNYHTDPGYISYFVHNSNPKPDFISWHEYTCSSSDSAQTCINNISSWAGHVTDTKNAITAAGNSVPPIFITEWNYDPQNPSPDSRVTASFEQQFTQKALQELANIGVTGATHYVATGHTEYNLVDPTGRLTAEGTEFGVMYNLLIGGGSTPTPTSAQLTPTHTPTPTTASQSTTTPTPTLPQSGTAVAIAVCPHGLGNCGDNVTPNGGNTNPGHTTRQAKVTMLNASGAPVMTVNWNVNYNAPSAMFLGTVPLGTLPSGTYLVTISMDGFLPRQVPGFATITQGRTITLPSVSLVTGDINNDGQLDLVDYNILVGCYGSKVTTATCTNPPTSSSSGADINDDGVVDGVDYNYMIREFSVQRSGSQPTPSLANPTPTHTPTPSPTPSISKTPTTPPGSGYHVSGNTIYDAAGNPVIFRGVARPSLEWSSTGDHLSLADYQLMHSWNVKLVRLPMNQRSWLTNANNYQQTIDQNVQWIRSLGMNVLLDLHWSDKGSTSVTPAQQCMADTNSLTFWQQVATKYKSNTNIFFELYNEPQGISWPIWRNGGSACGFTVVGMQQLYNAVRSTGATNLVFIGGLNWAFDLSGVPANRIQGTNIVYDTHPYDFSGKNTQADWDKGFGFLTTTDPVVVTEFGDMNCSATFYSNLISYAESKKAGWIGWAWYPGGCSFPSLISDWSGAPNVPGQTVKSALLSH